MLMLKLRGWRLHTRRRRRYPAKMADGNFGGFVITANIAELVEDQTAASTFYSPRFSRPQERTGSHTGGEGRRASGTNMIKHTISDGYTTPFHPILLQVENSFNIMVQPILP